MNPRHMRWLDSLTESMDIFWANSWRQWRTEEPGVLESMESQWVRQDLATEKKKNSNDWGKMIWTLPPGTLIPLHMLLRAKYILFHSHRADTIPIIYQCGYNIRKVKATCQWPRGAGQMHKDWHAWLRDSEGLVGTSGYYQSIGFRCQASLKWLWQKESVCGVDECSQGWNLCIVKLKFKPWFTLVSELSNANMWYLARIPWTILEYFIVPQW